MLANYTAKGMSMTLVSHMRSNFEWSMAGKPQSINGFLKNLRRFRRDDHKHFSFQNLQVLLTTCMLSQLSHLLIYPLHIITQKIPASRSYLKSQDILYHPKRVGERKLRFLRSIPNSLHVSLIFFITAHGTRKILFHRIGGKS